ncbi:Hypothetical protein NTJ_10614 [Nesidiocoris tenuis]|uniref:Uncharacterized protein n=1 Tax=Nesidiocoris tenuis TaxID=355587 RepID=A0ABN7B2J4_9HEMI|nr:Hypothetical protein NTJ_10614 [Nesidiocoris tenuis]
MEGPREGGALLVWRINKLRLCEKERRTGAPAPPVGQRWKTMAKSNVRDEERTTAAGALGLPSRSVGAKTNPQQVPQLTQGSTIYTWPSHLVKSITSYQEQTADANVELCH